MNRKWLGSLILVGAAAALLNTSSCARSQQLVSITIEPGAVTFGAANPGQNANLTALGAYIHPPETKNITTQVTWATDTPQLVAVTSGGVVSPTGLGCGTANVSASYNHGTGPSGNVVIGYATITVDGPTADGCP